MSRPARPTPAMLEFLAVVAALEDERPSSAVYAREAARRRWPDSAAWGQRTHRHDGNAGAVGGTMPMLAGVMLSRLWDAGLVLRAGRGYRVTAAGRAVLEGSENSRENRAEKT